MIHVLTYMLFFSLLISLLHEFCVCIQTAEPPVASPSPNWMRFCFSRLKAWLRLARCIVLADVVSFSVCLFCFLNNATETYFCLALCKLHNHKPELRREILIILSSSALLCNNQIQYVLFSDSLCSFQLNNASYFYRSNNPKSKEEHADHMHRGNVSNRISMSIFLCLTLAVYVKMLLLYKAALTQIILWEFFFFFLSPWDKRVLLLQPPSQRRRQGGTGTRESKGWKFTAENKCSLFPEVICLCAPLSTDVRPLF